jgi:hypothetical protein
VSKHNKQKTGGSLLGGSLLRILTKVSIGAASLIAVVGVSFADVPLQNLGAGNDWDNYTVDASGNVVYNAATEGSGTGTPCPNNATCTVLDATGEGILQQKVQYDGDGTYYQTIIVEDGAASITDPSVQLTFRNESYVEVTNSSTNASMAAISVVKQGDLTAFDDYLLESENAMGALVGADPTTGTGLQATQRNHEVINGAAGASPTVDRVTETWIEDDNFGAGTRLAINQMNPVNEEQYSLRRVTGNYVQAGGTIALDNGDSITYAAGANLQVIYKTQAMDGTGDPFDRVMGNTIIEECTDNTCGAYTFDYSQINEDPLNPGVFTVGHAGGPGTQVTGAGPFLVNWDVGGSTEQTLFGAEPLTYEVNATDDGVVAPAATPTSSTTVQGASFWNAPPKWFDIVP